MKVLIMGLVLLLGCSTAAARQPVTDTNGFIHSWSTEQCQKLLDMRDAATWAAAFAGGLAGVGGLSAAFPDDDRKDARLGLGISSAVIAAAATSLTVLAKSKSTEFELYCNQDPAPVATPAEAKVETDVMLPAEEVYPEDGGV